MKKDCKRSGGFRVECESRRDGSGTLYLYGVVSFGLNEQRCKRFQTAGTVVSVWGDGLSVLTYRSGCVEVCGHILGVSCDSEAGCAGN